RGAQAGGGRGEAVLQRRDRVAAGVVDRAPLRVPGVLHAGQERGLLIDQGVQRGVGLLLERGEDAVDGLLRVVEGLGLGGGEAVRLLVGLRQLRAYLCRRGVDVVEVLGLARLGLIGLLVGLVDQAGAVGVADLLGGVGLGLEPVVVQRAVPEVALAVELRAEPG